MMRRPPKTYCKVRVLRESFEFSDVDGSGRLEQEELPKLLRVLGCAAHTAAQKAAESHAAEGQPMWGGWFPRKGSPSAAPARASSRNCSID